MTHTRVSRRKFLGTAGASASMLWLPHMAMAGTADEPRLVVVMLRGALDGLAVAPAYGDGNYRKKRGGLAFEPPGSEQGVRKLDGLFGLNPKLANMHALYGAGEFALVHAVATPYRERSHFDAQNALENGTGIAGGATDGWLNRAVGDMTRLGGGNGRELGVALGQNMPLLMRGPNNVANWAPSNIADVNEDTMSRLVDLYARDPLLSVRLEQALAAESMAAEGDDGMQASQASGKKKKKASRGKQLGINKELVRMAAKFLRSSKGPRVAVFDVGGWDTHANQGTVGGRLSFQLAALDEGVDALRSGLGPAWANTVVVMVTEFGRTVAVNGTRGTDHGTGACTMLMGGAVAGGKVYGDWPGLGSGDLLNDRDLRPTTDLRSVLKGVLHDHMGVAESALEGSIFPDSGQARIMEGLVRA